MGVPKDAPSLAHQSQPAGIGDRARRRAFVPLTVGAKLVIVSGSRYVIDYRGTHRFSVPPETVWAAIERTTEFERWWAWLGDFRLDGPGLQRGSALVGIVSPPLPYRMRIRVDLEDCVRPAAIDAAVHGDLEGRAHLAFEPDGGGTLATAAWTIEMMQLPMRVAARFARPLLRWGHDRVVEATVAGFRRQVEAAR